jgi:phosphomannomutase
MIKFGTEGWRGVISDEFNFENVRKVTRALAAYLINHKLTENPLIIGYDSRFLSERFAEEAVKVMEEAGVFTYLVERDTPTAVVAWEVKDKGAVGALMFTAASSPAQYSGMKFIKGQGGPRHEDCVKEIEMYIFLEKSKVSTSIPSQVLLNYQTAMSQMGKGQKAKSKVERFEPRERYIKYVTSVADWSRIRQSKPKIVVDPMYGSGRGYLDKILQELGCWVEEIHNYRDVLFGGKSPDPVEENLGELKAKMAEVKADTGIALNGDVTSFAVIDKEGKYQRPTAGTDAIMNILEIIARGVL